MKKIKWAPTKGATSFREKCPGDICQPSSLIGCSSLPLKTPSHKTSQDFNKGFQQLSNHGCPCLVCHSFKTPSLMTSSLWTQSCNRKLSAGTCIWSKHTRDTPPPPVSSELLSSDWQHTFTPEQEHWAFNNLQRHTRSTSSFHFILCLISSKTLFQDALWIGWKNKQDSYERQEYVQKYLCGVFGLVWFLACCS